MARVTVRWVTAVARIVELERRLAARERELARLRDGADAPSTGGSVLWSLRVAAVVVIALALIAVLSPVDGEVVADTIPAWAHHATALAVVAVFVALLVPGAGARWRGPRIFLLFIPTFLAGGIGADLPSQLNHDRARGPSVVARVAVLSRSPSSPGDSPRDALVLASWQP